MFLCGLSLALLWHLIRANPHAFLLSLHPVVVLVPCQRVFFLCQDHIQLCRWLNMFQLFAFFYSNNVAILSFFPASILGSIKPQNCSYWL